LILGPISAVLKKEKIGKKEKEYLKTARKSGKHLLQLVNEILDLTKLESDTLTTQEEVVNLYDYAKRISVMYESYARQKGLQLGFGYVGDKNLQVLLDTDKFEKIFNNLMSNAIKFTDAGGKVDIKFKDLGESIQFKIEDSGMGIHPDDLPHIFERFYQSEQKEQSAKWGTGIGLAICTEMTHLLKGKISAESKLGEGATFIVEIPKKIPPVEKPQSNPLPIQVAEEIVNGVATRKDTILPSKNGGATKILIVEDNRELNDYLKNILEDKYQVKRAYHGLEALDILEEENKNESGVNGQSIDLIVSDVMMPQMDGFELLKKLKATPAWHSIPIIILTARAGLKDKLHALRTGVDDYMVKPFEEEELLARVKNLLANRKERQKYAPKMALDQNFNGLSDEDVEWLSRLEDHVQKNIGNFNLSAEMIADEMALSRSQLFRKLKYLTGLTPIKYVQEVRFNHARSILENNTFSSVKSVAYEVGFKQVKYFSQQFKKRFGKSPSDYLK
jgi:DNA-binding response OmpR family regulator/two-component sensor histidine kinase